MSQLSESGNSATDAQKKPGLKRNQLITIGVVAIVAMLIIGSLVGGGGEGSRFGVANNSFLILALLSFAAGVLSFLSPCTMPILTAYFAFAFQNGRRQIAGNTLMFLLGLATMFSLLGATASAIGRFLLTNQQVLIIFGGGLVLVFGVMNLMGKGFAGLQKESGGDQPPEATMGGSFVFGVTFAIGWSGCIGPILGAVLGLAGTSSETVLEGMLLLFIYAMGLGLPLLLVATMFGKLRRDHIIWRFLRGRGWTLTVPTLLIALVWALTVWRILVAAADFALFNLMDRQLITTTHVAGLFIIAALGVALWMFSSEKGREKMTTLNLHSTQIFSGVMFVVLGFFLLNGTLSTLSSTFQEWEPIDNIRYWLFDQFSS